jgi:hypothetical protein
MTGAWGLAARVDGPLPAGDAPWHQRAAGLSGEGMVGVGLFEFNGLSGDGGAVRWRLADGRIELNRDPERPSSFAVNDGIVRVLGYVDLTGNEPVYRLPAQATVVENVHLTREMARKFLRYISPLVGYSVRPEGRMFVEMATVDFPLGPSAKERALAQGAFEIREYSARIAEPFGTLLRYSGIEPEAGEQTFGPVPIDCRDGVFHLDDQVVALNEGLWMSVNGTVGVDQTLDLVVTLPLTEALLQKYGVLVQVKDALPDEAITVPVTGTFSDPRLDEKELARQILRIGAKMFGRQLGDDGGWGDLLRDILRPRDD